MKSCIVNIGLYRTGTTTLSKAAEELDLSVFRECPTLDSPNFNAKLLKAFLFDPTAVINDFIDKRSEYFVEILQENDFVCDGWCPLLALASQSLLDKLVGKAKEAGVQIKFIATERSNKSSYLKSELHHWIRHDLEKKVNLNYIERCKIEQSLIQRYDKHFDRISNIPGVIKLELNSIEEWGKSLSTIRVPRKQLSEKRWNMALSKVGKQNSSPELPIQGVLLTMRIVVDFEGCVRNIINLLEDIEKDSLCRYMLVLSLDQDEFGTKEAKKLSAMMEERARMDSFYLLQNNRPKVENTVPICHIWHDMALHAWQKGASWVVFLGDDIRIKCPFHYRAIYRSFLNIQKTLGLPDGHMFGCPWFNDEGFQGFPTFPVMGRDHYDIFQGLIPRKHQTLFVNQDLDPYLQRLYLKFGAAPVLTDVILTNGFGGSDEKEARYKRVSAINWREKVLQDVSPILTHLKEIGCLHVEKSMKLLLDVVIPSFRIDKEYLKRLCQLEVPPYMRTSFIVIIDNPVKLKAMEGVDDSQEAAGLLEAFLCENSNNNIRVRCNEVNLGASATRNRGIKESAAEYILFLDDDVIPSRDLLDQYGKELLIYQEKKEDILGLVGMVYFPRKNLKILHAAVLMSYLVFMFEIAENDIYSKPAWGVTANILFKKMPGMEFDVRYAKTGGGEDVDFALRLSKISNGLELRSLPSAKVSHPFWKGGLYSLCIHFFNWAIGDGALFYRFPELTYISFPNFPETWLVLAVLMATSASSAKYFISHLSIFSSLMFASDFLVDATWNLGTEFTHRQSILSKHDGGAEKLPFTFILCSHLLANFYVIILEFGRLYGHIKRGHFRNIMRRFDWHCGLLRYSAQNFRFREGCKFICFCISFVMAMNL